MYSTCLHCTRDLGRNDMLATLPIGRRVVFDSAQGRLWVVCKHCGKWNLVPFDTRLETIDACERLFHDTRTRYSTDNIGIARVADGLDLVRIGVALRPEFASWRFGQQYARRRRTAYAIGALGAVAAVSAAVGVRAATGVGLFVGTFGWNVVEWGFRGAIASRRRAIVTLPDDSGDAKLSPLVLQTAELVWRETSPSLLVHTHGGIEWDWSKAGGVTKRVIGTLNQLAGSRQHVTRALETLDGERGDLQRWLRSHAKRSALGPARHTADGDSGYQPRAPRQPLIPRLLLHQMPPADRLAVEMWLSEDDEPRWLEGELALLEREWREAERLAKIADDLVLANVERDA